jgi:hypothetical protein
MVPEEPAECESEGKRSMIGEQVDYGLLGPNSYNPNVMPPRIYEAELESILEFGFVDPITVRDGDIAVFVDGRLEIIDGEHRWKAFGELRRQWLAGEMKPEWVAIMHPTLPQLFELNQIPVSNLGIVSDAKAMKLTIILNELRGKANMIDVAAILAQIGEATDGEGLKTSLPYADEEVVEMLRLNSYDWEAARNVPAPGGDGSDTEENVDDMVTLTLILSNAAHGVLQEAFEKIRTDLAERDISLHQNPKMALGQVVQEMAVRLISA